MKPHRQFIISVAAGLLFLQGVSGEIRGPVVDKIVFNARSQEDLGLMDVASGISDIWNYSTSGGVFKRLPEGVKDKLGIYAVSGASYLGLLINPFPDKAPYLTEAASDASGKARFNPLAIRKVRYALNWLVNRQKIVDEILAGAGLPMFTPVVPGLPNASRFDLLAAVQGMTAQGNETKALADIDAALKEAAVLPELAGKLVKSGGWWTFDGQPVTVKFVMRADDPNVRLPEGRYVADQIEKAGIKVERIEVDRVKAYSLYGETDPRSNQWNIYTEGLGSNQTNAYWETTLSQMYAPWASVMPGNNNKSFWNYRQDELDRLSTAAVNGQFATAGEYWNLTLGAATLGMKESVRILLAAKTSYLAANKDRFNSRMAYGLADGINKWSMYTADVKPETSGPDAGKKVLKMTGFSARGALFMNAWDPVGPNGFGDTYSGIVMKEASDLEMEPHPASGLMMGVRASWSKVVHAAEGLKVPKDAVIWDAASQKWESGVVYAKNADGSFFYQAAAERKALSQAIFSFRFGSWHHGRPVDLNDYRYAFAFRYDVAYRKTVADRLYDSSYASGVNPRLVRTKALVFNPDQTITVYGDVNFPMDQAQLASMLVPSLQVSAINSGSVLPWEILEALKSLVAESNASGTAYSFNSDNRFVEVDLLTRKTLEDIKAKLKEFILARRVPASLQGFVSPDQAVENYRKTLAWVEQHGHAYISNGGFILDQYDPAGNTGVLIANRDPSYPFARGSWITSLKLETSRIDSVLCADWQKGKDLKVTVQVSQVSYPEGTAVPAGNARVSVLLKEGEKEYRVTAVRVKPGVYEAVLSRQELEKLPSGVHTLAAESDLGDGLAPGVGTGRFMKF